MKNMGLKDMDKFTVDEMLEMQRMLQEKYKDKWEGISPEAGKNKLLWMLGEAGEVIDIVKKHGGGKACSDAVLRPQLIEELADVLMYYNDCCCATISPRMNSKPPTKKNSGGIWRDGEQSKAVNCLSSPRLLIVLSLGRKLYSEPRPS